MQKDEGPFQRVSCWAAQAHDLYLCSISGSEARRVWLQALHGLDKGTQVKHGGEERLNNAAMLQCCNAAMLHLILRYFGALNAIISNLKLQLFILCTSQVVEPPHSEL